MIVIFCHCPDQPVVALCRVGAVAHELHHVVDGDVGVAAAVKHPAAVGAPRTDTGEEKVVASSYCLRSRPIDPKVVRQSVS